MMQNPIKILLIADDLTHIQQIRRLLADSTRATQAHAPAYEVLHSDRLAMAIAYLNTIHFDLIILSVGLADGAERLAEIQAYSGDTPVIVVGEAADDGRWAIRQGVQDFLARPLLTPAMLNRTIGFVRERQMLAATAVPYRLLVENNADGIVVVSKQGIVLFANAAAAHILQQEPETLIGEKFSLPLPRKDTAEFNVVREDAQPTAIEMRLVETDWQGERVYLASLRDITSHQRAKIAMREKAAELEVRNIALDEFAHTMAHQVQGLLSQMVGYASYLEMQYGRALDEEFATVVSRIVQSGHKMNNVISELLLLASMRGSDVTVEPLHMQRVVAEVLKRLRYQIEQSEVEIVLPESWPVALGHGSWIEEVWVNYLSNGIKYGGDPPRLEFGSTLTPDGMARFWVRDNGIGIPDIDQKLLFKPHTRLGPKQIRGEGLGLSIVRRLVARCGGEVGVESQEGCGSLFWFSLPLADGVDTAVDNHDST
ncbi:MAG: PAS domain S-box protein [Anaerolineae bacterium]|nr:PAS domain S-box protein [Anaerolineae bacterium]